MTYGTDISQLLAQQIERLFSREVTRERLTAVEHGAFDTPLWRHVEELGTGLALAPADGGGADLTWQDVEPVLRALGSWAVPVPLGETMIAAWALGKAGLAIPDGPLAIAGEPFALDENGAVHGDAPLVAWAQHAHHLVAVAQNQKQRVVCLLQRDDLTLRPVETLARIPACRVEAVNIVPSALAPIDGWLGQLGLLPLLATLRTVQMAGALERLLALCVDYGNTREQFGRPIGKFQAVQHLIADIAAQAAAAQVAGLFACRQIDRGNGEYGAAVAKARTGLAATQGAEAAHQIFGAIGFTDEHILHHYSRRLWQWRDEAGSEHWWAERLGEQVLARGGAALWPSITARTPTTEQ